MRKDYTVALNLQTSGVDDPDHDSREFLRLRRQRELGRATATRRSTS